MADQQPILAHTKHGDLTLDQLGELQPGLSQLMPQVSERYWILYYAAQGGNWALADYQLRSLRSLWRKMSVTRPKYEAMLADFAARIFDPLAGHIATRDFAGFAAVYQDGIALANKLHGATRHPEIVWKLPPQPPQHLELGPAKIPSRG